MNNKIIICGAGGSGKDYMKRKYEKKGFRTGILDTSRPIRKREVNKVDYNFLTSETILSDEINDKYIDVSSYNGWHYGFSHEQWNNNNLFVLTPKIINKLNKLKLLDNTIIIYLDIAENVRIERLSKRNDSDNVKRRINSDRTDFNNFTIYDIVIKNELF